MDPYKVLGVSYDSSDEEIKKAYKTLSRKYHPDANIGNPNQAEYEEKFKEVQQAYHMIMDPLFFFPFAKLYFSQTPEYSIFLSISTFSISGNLSNLEVHCPISNINISSTLSSKSSSLKNSFNGL